MTIDFDLTFVLQMALFAGLIVVLKPLLFDPLLKVFEAREQMTEGAKDSARAMQEKAGALLQQYQQELSKVHEVARAERERVRAETAELESEMMVQARQSANQILEEGRARIDAEVARIKPELLHEGESLAATIAERVVGRSLA